ncbi:MAG: hypothetical protein IPJ88_16020 [Myxococcales bacterium]|nr:MAG: hypothetical protein IPJ88_16020 [Myxococcales bacterium]
MHATDSDSSVMANLQELMELQKQRVRDENARIQTQLAKQEALRQAEEQRQQAAREASVKQHEEKKREQERQAAEEENRLALARHAAEVRLRLQAAQHERLSREATQLAHERALSRIRQKQGWRLASSTGLAIFCILGTLLGSSYFLYLQPRFERYATQAQRERVLREKLQQQQTLISAKLDQLKQSLHEQQTHDSDEGKQSMTKPVKRVHKKPVESRSQHKTTKTKRLTGFGSLNSNDPLFGLPAP